MPGSRRRLCPRSEGHTSRAPPEPHIFSQPDTLTPTPTATGSDRLMLANQSKYYNPSMPTLAINPCLLWEGASREPCFSMTGRLCPHVGKALGFPEDWLSTPFHPCIPRVGFPAGPGTQQSLTPAAPDSGLSSGPWAAGATT